MSVYLRRLRGVAGIGPLWAAVWVVMFTALTYILQRFLPFDGDVGSASLTSTIGWVGLVSGGVFDR